MTDQAPTNLQNVQVKRGGTLVVVADLTRDRILNLDIDPGGICVIAATAEEAESVIRTLTEGDRHP